MKTKRELKMSHDPARRNFFRTGVAATGAVLVASGETQAQVPPAVLPPSPATVPWVDELPVYLPKQPVVGGLSPAATNAPVPGECGREQHEAWAQFPPQKYYEMHVREGTHKFHRDYPAQTIWGYDGITPGPVFHARYGEPIIVRIHNDLPANLQGPGSPEISTHLHNLHTPSASDGFPGNYFSPTKYGPTLSAPGGFQDHHYPNVCAGVDELNPIGDSREALGTLWYHDHRVDFTAANLLRGLAGFYIMFDPLDSGNERTGVASALRLPSGKYDVPIMLTDRRFDSGGYVLWDQLSPEGVLGDKIALNGKIEPAFRVARRKYRFRLLNGGPSRFYQLYIVTANDVVQPFTYIANDGNLLPAPLLNQTRVRLGVAERGDIVVDFSKYPIGTELYVTNRLWQEDTRGPKDVRAPGTRIMKIIVDRNAPEIDMSRVLPALRPLPPLPADIASLPVRRFVFARNNGLWTVNDQLVDVNSPRFTVKKGSSEVWELVNPSGGWSHPVHIHFEEGRILSRTREGINVPVPAHEQGRKDVYELGPNSTVKVLLRFRDFTGKYIMHCHNTVHEDHAMMLRWDIED